MTQSSTSKTEENKSVEDINNKQQIEESLVNLYDRKLGEIVCNRRGLNNHEIKLYNRMLVKKKP